jgi:hypothetical protein
MDLSYDADVFVCTKCGSEYRLHLARCVDCGAPTQKKAFTEPSRQSLRLPPGTEGLCKVRSDTLEWAESFGSFLEEHGIPWTLEVLPELRASKYRRDFGYCVCVREEDRYRAHELEQEHLLLENPGLAEEYTELPAGNQCPVCGSLTSPDKPECPGCGLVLYGPLDGDEEDEEEKE